MGSVCENYACIIGVWSIHCVVYYQRGILSARYIISAVYYQRSILSAQYIISAVYYQRSILSAQYIISAVAALHYLALAEEQAPKYLWPLEWLVACVDGCIDTRG